LSVSHYRLEPIEPVRDRIDDTGRGEHPDLDGGGIDVIAAMPTPLLGTGTVTAAIVHSPKREVCDCQSHGIDGLLSSASTSPIARGPRDFMRLGVGLPTSLPNVR
jgi:hypothetical protein